MSHYTDPANVGPSCTYATLSNYNQVNNPQPTVARGTVIGKQVVPSWGGISYDTFGKNPNCSGYKTIGETNMGNGLSCNQQYATVACNK